MILYFDTLECESRNWILKDNVLEEFRFDFTLHLRSLLFSLFSESDPDYFDCFIFFQKVSRLTNLFKFQSNLGSICFFDHFYALSCQS